MDVAQKGFLATKIYELQITFPFPLHSRYLEAEGGTLASSLAGSERRGGKFQKGFPISENASDFASLRHNK